MLMEQLDVLIEEKKYQQGQFLMLMKIHIIQAMWQQIFIIIIKKIFNYLQKWDSNLSVYLLTGQEFSLMEMKKNLMKKDYNFMMMFLMKC